VTRAGVAFGVVVAAALASGPPPAPHAGEGGGVVAIADGKTTFCLRFEIEIAGKSSEAAWEAFLDRTFDYFDRDGDGSLSRAEAGRMFSFPLPGRRELAVNFDQLDADGDGKGSRAELKAYCRRGGFTPVVLLTEPASADDLRLADVLMRHLDTDRDGKISVSELKQAPRLIERFDADDDEALDRAELLAFAAPGRPMTSARVKPAVGVADAVLRVSLGAKTQSATIEGKGAKRLRLTAPAFARHTYQLHGPASGWLATFLAARAGPDMRAANGFILAQFEGALGGRSSLAKADLEDPTVSGMGELFRFADRDGDGKLTASELKAYLELVRMGVQTQTWVRVTERGRSLFNLLDADGDGRLSYRELARAANRLNGIATLPAVIPWQVQVSFGGPAVPSWGGVPLPAPRRPRPGGGSAPNAPRWFQAMDRNGDGVLSPREFVGPPELFRRLDADGDGVITVEEAVRIGDS
jgi:Ca2+-binding EF-hand superfamily protein